MYQPDWGDHPELDMPESVELNLTSLVDVMLVLLIIFMVSSAVMGESGKPDADSGLVDLQLPSGQVQSTAPATTEVLVQINSDGALFQSGTATDQRALAKELTARMAKEPDLQVRIEADQRLPYQKVAELLAELQSLGVKNVSLGMGAR